MIIEDSEDESGSEGKAGKGKELGEESDDDDNTLLQWTT
jgi:hypothetical protein